MSRSGALALTTALVLLPPSAAVAGDNPAFTIPLHAKLTAPEPLCLVSADCANLPPRVNVPPDTLITVFVLVNNYTGITGLQTAFEWDPSWTILGGACDCRMSDVCAGPWEEGGPGGGNSNLAVASLSCVSGPAVAAVARMFFRTGSAGCLEQVQSGYPFGIHAVDCRGGQDLISPYDPAGQLRLGKICVGQGGRDACMVTPVEARTWGAIKATYP